MFTFSGSSSSEDDDDFNPRGSSSQVSQNQSSTRNPNFRSPERRSARNNSSQSISQERQPAQRNRNQPGTSRAQPTTSRNQATTNKNQAPSATTSKPTGAAKRKQKNKTIGFKGHPLQEIRFFQHHTENCIPMAPFCRVVKEILHSHGDFRMTKESLDALQTACESYLVGIFGDAYRLTLHRCRVTISPQDINLLMYLRGVTDPGLP